MDTGLVDRVLTWCLCWSFVTAQAALMGMVQEDLQRLYADLDRNIGERVSVATSQMSAERERRDVEIRDVQVSVAPSCVRLDHGRTHSR